MRSAAGWALGAAVFLSACAGPMPRRAGYDRSCGCWGGTSPSTGPARAAAPKTESGTSSKGLASFYAEDFDGKPTASGEAFSSSARTAAHRTWSFGTRVKVTSTRSGKSTEVRINDRGPHVEGRIIDLSKAAAEDIGLLAEGVGEVELEVLP